MIARRILVSYRDETSKKKLEDYISEVTNNPIDLGSIGYDGELTINTMNIDLTSIGRTNITCAAAFPGMKFTDIDKFIEWHKRISKMGYIEAARNIKGPNDIIALYYNSKEDLMTYVCITMYDKSSINKYLGDSNGKAIPFDFEHNKYWLLSGKTNSNALLFRKTDKENRPFESVSTSREYMNVLWYLISL